MKIKKVLLAFVLIFSLALVPSQILAQDATPELISATNTEADIIDEIITPEDLGIEEQDVLPDSAWYPFKEMWRTFRTATTFNKLKKAELKLQHANERIIEAQALVEAEGDEKSIEKLERAMEKYEQDLEKVQIAISKVDEKAEENPKLDKFIDKLADSQIKQQKLMQKLENKVPEHVISNIIKARQNSTKQFSDVLSQVIPQGQIADRIEKALDAQIGTQFKDLKNLEILKQMQENLPDKAKEHLTKAEEKILDKFSKKMENIDKKNLDEMEKYFQKTRGNEINKLKLLDKLKAKENLPEDVIEQINKAQELSAQKFEQRMKKINNKELRDQLLEDLKDGDLDDIRALKNINDKISPEFKKELKAIDEESKKAFQKKFFDSIDGEPQKLEDLKRKLENNPDPLSLSIIQDLENDLPDDKKKFAEILKRDTAKEFEKRINKDGDKFLRKFQNHDPAAIERLEELKEFLPQQALPGIEKAIKAQVDAMNKHMDKLDPKKRKKAMEIQERRMQKHDQATSSHTLDDGSFEQYDKNMKKQIEKLQKRVNQITPEERKELEEILKKEKKDVPIPPKKEIIKQINKDKKQAIHEMQQAKQEIIKDMIPKPPIKNQIEEPYKMEVKDGERGIIRTQDNAKEVFEENPNLKKLMEQRINNNMN